jgi:hypothetical protein
MYQLTRHTAARRELREVLPPALLWRALAWREWVLVELRPEYHW